MWNYPILTLSVNQKNYYLNLDNNKTLTIIKKMYVFFGK